MSLSLIIISCLKLSYFFYLHFLSIFMSTETNVVTNLKYLNSVNNSIGLLLIANSTSLSCSSGLKGFEVSTV